MMITKRPVVVFYGAWIWTDELQEGDQIQVKCIGLEGNKIKLSRKAVLKELREQMKKGKEDGVAVQ